jgi:hypothetical protein
MCVQELSVAHIREIGQYRSPPQVVATTMAGVMAVLNLPQDWKSVKRQLQNPVNFLETLSELQMPSRRTLIAIRNITSQPAFDIDSITAVSKTVGPFARWLLLLSRLAN